jgi:CheY-like chemotaxis protein
MSTFTLPLGEKTQKPTVLLIDTNLIVAEATCMLLQNHHYHCVIVNTVDAILEQSKFDVIVSALHIEEDFDAIDLIKHLQARHPCPLIVVTGESSARANEHLQDLQPVAIIGKPYDDAALLNALAAATAEPHDAMSARPRTAE